MHGSGEDEVSPMLVGSNVGNDLSAVILDAYQDAVPMNQVVDCGADGKFFRLLHENSLPPTWRWKF